MNGIAVLLGLINGYKTYSAVIAAVVSGVGMILTKDYGGGVSETLSHKVNIWRVFGVVMA
jgi:hypothetical protein